MAIDILIPLGKGSAHKNIELRYTLRAIEKHLSGYGNIYLIGERPVWLKNIIHIPLKDQHFSENKCRNIYNKIMAGCALPELSEDFLFFSDDHFLNADITASAFPFHHKGPLTREGRGKEDTYGFLLKNTLELFPGTNNFNVHGPILYNKEKFKAMIIPWKPFGFGIKTVYCNTYGIEGSYYPECKIAKSLKVDAIMGMIKERLYFSISNRAFDGEIRNVLECLFPKKSSFEC